MATDPASAGSPPIAMPENHIVPAIARVPAEIRNKIYDEVFRDMPWHHTWSPRRGHHSLLTTCRKIRQETMHIWYSRVNSYHMVHTRRSTRRALAWLDWLEGESDDLPWSLRTVSFFYLHGSIANRAAKGLEPRGSTMVPAISPYKHTLKIDLTSTPPDVTFLYMVTSPGALRDLYVWERYTLACLRDFIAHNGDRQPNGQTALSAESWRTIIVFLDSLHQLNDYIA